MTHEVEVAVLGPVQVRGAAQPFHRVAASELVVYLSFHREGVRNGEWALALWPDRAVSPATVHSTVSDARRALGQTPSGVPRLPRGPRLSLHAVQTDLDRFDAFVQSENWSAAAQLLRGPVFGGLRRSDWAVLDGTLAQVEAAVVRAVLHGAERLMHRGRAAQSESILRRGLVVAPYDERLYRALLRALAGQGNRVGLRSAMAQLLTLAGEAPAGSAAMAPGGLILDTLHPETTSLYRELLYG